MIIKHGTFRILGSIPNHPKLRYVCIEAHALGTPHLQAPSIFSKLWAQHAGSVETSQNGWTSMGYPSISIDIHDFLWSHHAQNCFKLLQTASSTSDIPRNSPWQSSLFPSQVPLTIAPIQLLSAEAPAPQGSICRAPHWTSRERIAHRNSPQLPPVKDVVMVTVLLADGDPLSST